VRSVKPKQLLWVIPAGVLGFSAVAKLAARGFSEYLGGTQMFPRSVVPLVAWLVIGLELFTALMLGWPAGRRVGWYLSGALGSAFVVYHAFLVAAGDVYPCGCCGFLVSWDGTRGHTVFSIAAAGLLVFAFAGLRYGISRPNAASGG
jgi:hypothetical protein